MTPALDIGTSVRSTTGKRGAGLILKLEGQHGYVRWDAGNGIRLSWELLSDLEAIHNRSVRPISGGAPCAWGSCPAEATTLVQEIYGATQGEARPLCAEHAELDAITGQIGKRVLAERELHDLDHQEALDAGGPLDTLMGNAPEQDGEPELERLRRLPTTDPLRPEVKAWAEQTVKRINALPQSPSREMAAALHEDDRDELLAAEAPSVGHDGLAPNHVARCEHGRTSEEACEPCAQQAREENTCPGCGREPVEMPRCAGCGLELI